MKKLIITYISIIVLTLSFFDTGAQSFIPDTDGKYSISYSGEVLGEYTITVIKGIYETEAAALDALYEAQDSDIIFFDSKRADKDGNVVFDTVVPLTYTDAGVFISGTGLEKPVYLGEFLSDGNTDIAKAVFVGIEESYTVKGKGSSEITETVTAYTVDSFGYPTLSNPDLTIELENGDEYVSLSDDGLLCISPVAEEKTYTLRASLENGFSDTFSFDIKREAPIPYEIFLFRADAHDRPLEKASITGTDGIYPSFEVYAEILDQFGNKTDDGLIFFVNGLEYPDSFTPESEGEYTVYVACSTNTNVKASVALTVTNRPAYEDNAALLYGAFLEAHKEADRIDYNVFISTENGKDFFPGTLWTTAEALNALMAAAENADSFLLRYESGEITGEQYFEEYEKLVSAIETYRSLVKDGIRKDATSVELSIKPSSQATIPVTDGIINLQPGKPNINYVTLTATMSPDDHTDIITWTSSNPDAVSIKEAGTFSVNISGTNVGKATVTATTRNGLTASCDFNIYKPFTSVHITKNASMLLGDAPITLTHSVTPENSGDYLVWKSSDESVVTVDQNGTVTAVGTGKAKITATSLNGVKGTSEIIVGLPADTITLGENISDIINMQTLTSLLINAKASRLDGLEPLNSEVSYEVIKMVPQSDTLARREVIKVYPNGKITAQFGGTAIVRITAVSALGMIYRDIFVNVFAPAQSILLSSLRKTVLIGDSISLYSSVYPDDSAENVTWYSSNENIVTVNENGLVTAISRGTARVYAVSDSGVSKYCTISTGYGPDFIKITSLVSSVAVGELAHIRATALRENGFPCIDSGVSYSIISGKEHLQINSYGVITGISSGTATVRIYSTADPTVQKEISIRVCEKITEISFTKKSEKMYIGQELDFTSMIKALPETHTDLITWESMDTDVITVDENGCATAISLGNARLYAYGGNVSSFIEIQVIEGAQKVEISPLKTDILTYGDSLILSAKVFDENENILTSGVTWESSDTDIISISPDGKAKAGSKQGTATITAKAVAGNVTDSISITVIPALYEATTEENEIILEAGESIDTKSILLLYDSDGNNIDKEHCTFALRSRNEGIASIDGTQITAISEGITSVRIIIYCGKVSRNINITVTVIGNEDSESPQAELLSDKEVDDFTKADVVSRPTPIGIESI